MNNENQILVIKLEQLKQKAAIHARIEIAHQLLMDRLKEIENAQ